MLRELWHIYPDAKSRVELSCTADRGVLLESARSCVQFLRTYPNDETTDALHAVRESLEQCLVGLWPMEQDEITVTINLLLAKPHEALPGAR